MLTRNMADSSRYQASHAAGGNTETLPATIEKIYTDPLGNVTHADARPPGFLQPLEEIENASGLALYVGAVVTVNYARGSRFLPQIIGMGEASSGAVISEGASAATAGLTDSTQEDTSLAGIPFLTESDTTEAPDAFTVAPGANVLLTSLLPEDTSGGPLNRRLTIAAKVLVLTSLPNPTTSGLPDGTLVDLIDSYGDPGGMYRLDGIAHQWRRRDTGTGGSGGGSTPPVFGASGSGHSTGLVPDPGATPGTTKYLREDATWQVPPGGGGLVPLVKDTADRDVCCYVAPTSSQIQSGGFAYGGTWTDSAFPGQAQPCALISTYLNHAYQFGFDAPQAGIFHLYIDACRNINMVSIQYNDGLGNLSGNVCNCTKTTMPTQGYFQNFDMGVTVTLVQGWNIIYFQTVALSGSGIGDFAAIKRLKFIP